MVGEIRDQPHKYKYDTLMNLENTPSLHKLIKHLKTHDWRFLPESAANEFDPHND